MLGIGVRRLNPFTLSQQKPQPWRKGENRSVTPRTEARVAPSLSRWWCGGGRWALRLRLRVRSSHRLQRDIMRYSDGSYLDAKYQDRNMVKENMGHSDFKTYEQDYRKALTLKQGEEFWSIFPPE